MLEMLIILVRKLNFVTLRHNRFLKTIFETTLSCTLSRGGSRTAATSKVQISVIIVNGWKPLTIITKSSTVDVAAVLDPPLL